MNKLLYCTSTKCDVFRGHSTYNVKSAESNQHYPFNSVSIYKSSPIKALPSIMDSRPHLQQYANILLVKKHYANILPVKKHKGVN